MSDEHRRIKQAICMRHDLTWTSATLGSFCSGGSDEVERYPFR